MICLRTKVTTWVFGNHKHKNPKSKLPKAGELITKERQNSNWDFRSKSSDHKNTTMNLWASETQPTKSPGFYIPTFGKLQVLFKKSKICFAPWKQCLLYSMLQKWTYCRGFDNFDCSMCTWSTWSGKTLWMTIGGSCFFSNEIVI